MFAINVVMHDDTEWMCTGMTRSECLGNMYKELHEEYGVNLYFKSVFAIQNNEQDEDVENEFATYCEATQVTPVFTQAVN